MIADEPSTQEYTGTVDVQSLIQGLDSQFNDIDEIFNDLAICDNDEYANPQSDM